MSDGDSGCSGNTNDINHCYIVTGRAAHGRIGRLFQKLIKENAADIDDVDVEAGAPDISISCSNSSWIDKSPYAATKDGINNNINKNGDNNGEHHQQQQLAGDHDYARSTTTTTKTIDHIAFLWENAPQYNTRAIRDTVSCYSHLPFGILLDDKWALARLLGGKNGGSANAINGANDNYEKNGGGDGDDALKDPNLATLESHCFRGIEFVKFAKRVGLLPTSTKPDESTSRQKQAVLTSAVTSGTTTKASTSATIAPLPIVADGEESHVPRYQFEDLILPSSSSRKSSSSSSSSSSILPTQLPLPPPPSPTNLWVIKDAMSNGAGGIWIVDESNVHDFFLVEESKHQDDEDDINEGVNNVNGNNHGHCNKTIATTTTSSSSSSSTTISPKTAILLHPTHRYVAQRYAWPPTLYNGRKCHVRVYALITCTGEAFIHRRAFLHVANELFAFTGDLHRGGGDEYDGERSGKKVFHSSVHITNCCANSHDASKFAGEICVDLEQMSHPSDDTAHNIDVCDVNMPSSPSDPVPLGEYLPSISASVAALAQSFLPFLRGGEANGGFEYLGLDFVLSSVEEAGDFDDCNQRNGVKESLKVNTGNGAFAPVIDMQLYSTETTVTRKRRQPVAYLLEVNAPPSQDTATGLQHAEDLHDAVITDLLRLWVLPNVEPSWLSNRWRSRSGTSTFHVDNDDIDHHSCGGWRCVYPLKPTTATTGINDTTEKAIKSEMILPSKAAIINRIRWALFEKKATKEYELMCNSDVVCSKNDKNDDNNKDSDGGFDCGSTSNNDADDVNINGSGGGISSHSIKDHSGTNRSSTVNCEQYQPSMMSPSPNDLNQFVTFARSQFPYFDYKPSSNRSTYKQHCTTSSNTCGIFFESGGGSQVPKVVQNAMVRSLSHRDRSVVGTRLQIEARLALTSLLVRRDNSFTNINATNARQLRKPQLCQDEGISFDSQMIIMGTNASCLLAEIARRMHESGVIDQGDEIIISSENHLANVTPWLKIARSAGASVKWWTVTGATTVGSKIDHHGHCGQSSCILSDLVTERTKVVAVSHVSNILGLERDISSTCDYIHRMTKGKGQVVVDGVAAAPHLLKSDATSTEQIPDWYVVSLHKLFGPHLGCLVCKRSVAQMLHPGGNGTVCGAEPTAVAALLPDAILARSWELGTMNYEACCGATALYNYFVTIGSKASELFGKTGIECVGDELGMTYSSQPTNQITSESSNDHRGEDEMELPFSRAAAPFSFYVNVAGIYIHHVENRLMYHLLGYLQSCAPLVRIIQDVGVMKVTIDSEHTAQQNLNPRRVPIVCFLHANIASHRIVEHCRYNGVVCRACKFLSTDRLWNELGIESDAEVVRFSLAHYNTLEEIDQSIQILETLVGWN